MKNVYFDNAATTAIDPLVLREIKKTLHSVHGNPGVSNAPGLSAKKALEESRTGIARVTNCKPEEIVFTSGGTESNNLAIFGVADFFSTRVPYQKMHMVTTAIEHSSVLECFSRLERLGVSVDYVYPDSGGVISPEKIADVLKPNTVLVSVMYANNEIGTILPIRKISKILKSGISNFESVSGRTSPVFHVDACQAPLYLDVNKETLGADLITFDAHKIYGPKGIGCLYVSKHVQLSPIFFGGGQERGLRPGTENAPLALGMAVAFKLASVRRKKDSVKVAGLSAYFAEKIRKDVPEAVFNGTERDKLPNLVNISLPGIDSDLAVIRLSAKGIYCSSKSACMERGSSYVVESLGKSGLGNSSLRFSFSRLSKKNEVDYTVRTLRELFYGNLLSSK